MLIHEYFLMQLMCWVTVVEGPGRGKVASRRARGEGLAGGSVLLRLSSSLLFTLLFFSNSMTVVFLCYFFHCWWHGLHIWKKWQTKNVYSVIKHSLLATESDVYTPSPFSYLFCQLWEISVRLHFPWHEHVNMHRLLSMLPPHTDCYQKRLSLSLFILVFWLLHMLFRIVFV